MPMSGKSFDVQGNIFRKPHGGMYGASGMNSIPGTAMDTAPIPQGSLDPIIKKHLSGTSDKKDAGSSQWGSYAQIDDMREPFQGFPVGIICIKLDYPKIPGNVVNATTFPFPVVYEVLDFEIERLFEGDPSLEQLVLDAAKKLESSGVKVIVGACGYFAHFQQSVANHVGVPVFMSSLCQLPVIRLGLRKDARIGVLCANGENLSDAILSQIGETSHNLIIADVSKIDSFAPIRWGKDVLDNVALSRDLGTLSAEMRRRNPDMEAILLEFSDLPPYAYDIQQACGLPVFDFITMIEWVAKSVTQNRYL